MKNNKKKLSRKEGKGRVVCRLFNILTVDFLLRLISCLSFACCFFLYIDGVCARWSEQEKLSPPVVLSKWIFRDFSYERIFIWESQIFYFFFSMMMIPFDLQLEVFIIPIFIACKLRSFHISHSPRSFTDILNVWMMCESAKMEKLIFDSIFNIWNASEASQSRFQHSEHNSNRF